MRYDDLREGMYTQATEKVYIDVCPEGCIEQVKIHVRGFIVCKDNDEYPTWNLRNGYTETWEPYIGSMALFLT